MGRGQKTEHRGQTCRSMAARIGNFRELIVYQKAFELQCEIYKMTRSLPKEETYGLITQIRNSSRSVGANIAEAWQKRRYQAHFVSKLTDSDGEFKLPRRPVDGFVFVTLYDPLIS